MYLIFGGECFYASGGVNDLIEITNDKEYAIAKAKELEGKKAITHKPLPKDEEWDDESHLIIEWVQVFGLDENTLIYQSEKRPFADGPIIEISYDQDNTYQGMR